MVTKVNVETKTKKGILFNFNNGIPKIEVVDIPEESDYKELCKMIRANIIDICEFNKDIDIVIDDEGLLQEGNPLFEVSTAFGKTILAGNLLFLKKNYSKDGINLVGFNPIEAMNLLFALDGKVSFIGLTRGC